MVEPICAGVAGGESQRGEAAAPDQALTRSSTNARGRTFPLLTEAQGQIVLAPRGRHSEKPPAVRERIVELLGDRPRIELFARAHVAGWDAWGNEIDERDRAAPAAGSDADAA